MNFICYLHLSKFLQLLAARLVDVSAGWVSVARNKQPISSRFGDQLSLSAGRAFGSLGDCIDGAPLIRAFDNTRPLQTGPLFAYVAVFQRFSLMVCLHLFPALEQFAHKGRRSLQQDRDYNAVPGAGQRDVHQTSLFGIRKRLPGR